jgi:hypothetical protein
MFRRVVSLIFTSFLIASCSVLAPVPTSTPTQTATLLPTDTATPIPTATETNTPQPPTETPDSISALLPSGIPEKEWKGIPIMPGAINGGGDNESYRFTIKVTVEEVQTYYEKELAKLGWNLMVASSGDTDSVMLIFNNGAPPLLPVSIFSYEDLTLVLIVSSQ